MNLTFDKNLFLQVGLDSASLTMLGGITHRFMEPGQYRGAVYRDKQVIGSFYLNADKNSPVAQANIDLAAFDSNATPPGTAADSSCGCHEQSKTPTYDVNPKGYVLFHVSGGEGGFAVRVSKAVEDPKEQNAFDSRELKGEDIFSAVVLRPGTYSMTNLRGKARGEVVVNYPKAGKTPYRPPQPVSVECPEGGFRPNKVELHPGQAILFQCHGPSHIKLELTKADDGPADRPSHSRSGWKRAALPEPKAKA